MSRNFDRFQDRAKIKKRNTEKKPRRAHRSACATTTRVNPRVLRYRSVSLCASLALGNKEEDKKKKNGRQKLPKVPRNRNVGHYNELPVVVWLPRRRTKISALLSQTVEIGRAR